MKKQFLFLPFLASTLMIISSCSSARKIIYYDEDEDSDEFRYEEPNTSILPPLIDDGTTPGGDTPSSDPVVDKYEDLDIKNLANISANGTYTIEAEDLDLSGATLQAGCQSFYENPASQFPTSGGSCIACVASPTILAFKFTLNAAATVEFNIVCAKYEADYDLDANVQFHIDEEEPFVSNAKGNFFGHTEENQWYNWKTAKLGTLDLAKQTHVMYIRVIGGAFPNTDCFKLNVTNYGA